MNFDYKFAWKLKIINLKDIIQWDTINWSKALDFWESKFEEVADKNTPILTLGERNGGLSLWLATNGYKNICSDIELPKNEVHKLHEKYHVQEFISYQNINIFNIPFEDNSFDVVVVKSVIGGLKLVHTKTETMTLENQKKAITEIIRVLKPGGILLGAENMKGGLLHSIYRKLFNKNKDWRYLSQLELEFLLADFSEVNYKNYGYLGTLFSVDFMNTIFGCIDNFLSKIISNKSKYIGFYIAKK